MLAANISSRLARTFTAETRYFDDKLFGKPDKSGPQYAFYPTPEHAIEEYNAFARGPVAYKEAATALLYVHISFCDALRLLSRHHQRIGVNQIRAAGYLGYLENSSAWISPSPH